MVLMESAVSGHKFITIRERLADKLELLRFDPYSEYCFIAQNNWSTLNKQICIYYTILLL